MFILGFLRCVLGPRCGCCRQPVENTRPKNPGGATEPTTMGILFWPSNNGEFKAKPVKRQRGPVSEEDALFAGADAVSWR